MTARRPAVLAKVVTTLDVISRGRAVLGIGVGASDARAAERLAEGVAICRGLLAGRKPTMAGDFFRVDGAPTDRVPSARWHPHHRGHRRPFGEDVAVVLAAPGRRADRLAGRPGGAGRRRHDRPAIADRPPPPPLAIGPAAVTTIRVLSGEAGPTAPGMVAEELASALAEGFDALAVPLGVLVDEDAGDDEVAGAVGAAGGGRRWYGARHADRSARAGGQGPGPRPRARGRRSAPTPCRSSPRAPGCGSRRSTAPRSSPPTGWPQAEHPRSTATFCHATYLINLASPDPELAAKSRPCLAANLATADGMGADGLVLHIGSHRGQGFDTALPGVAEASSAPSTRSDAGVDGCPILLENAAGAGDTVGSLLRGAGRR